SPASAGKPRRDRAAALPSGKAAPPAAKKPRKKEVAKDKGAPRWLKAKRDAAAEAKRQEP
ncbi:hypothetical protein PA598K_06180, partial [Paenibacillus sp. 598K]